MDEVTPVREPGFITYLLNPDLEHDCYFVVQTPNSGMSERIGVVKKMLLAHSLVLRAELEESMLAMKGDIHVEDLFADTIRNLLKYVYGHDNVSSLCFDAADNLLYAAEKYMIKPLKNKLAEHLMSLLNAENICSLMNNPVCFTHLELQSTITMILQFETLKVLESPQFLDLRFDAFLTILEQDSLVVQEIEIWRAALKWAKHNAVCRDAQELRQKMSNHLKHIRFCTLTLEDLCKEVMPTGVLTYPEIQTVCSYICNKEPEPQLTDICDKTEPRSTPSFKSDIIHASISFSRRYFRSGKVVSLFSTKRFALELESFTLEAPMPRQRLQQDVDTYPVECTITIRKVTYSGGDAAEAHVVESRLRVSFGREFEVPINVNGENVQMKPNSKYEIEVKISHIVVCYSFPCYSSEDFTVGCLYSDGYYDSFINRINYRRVLKQVNTTV